jgi:haloalkane dehalogenase
MVDPFPYESKTFDRGGLALRYLDEGEGSTVVMVHGNPTWSIYYRSLVDALKADHRCIVPDHIGMGRSEKPGDDKYTYTLKSRVDDLEALLDHLGLQEDITLIVHDWGGMIGMAFASRHPERIARIVVMNTAGFPMPASKSFPWALRLARTPLGAWLIRGFNAFSGIAARVCAKKKPLSRQLKRAYTAPYDSWANRIATLRFVQDIPLKPGDPAWDIVSEVGEGLDRFAQTPMLICWGEKDFVFSLQFLEEWRKRLPHAEVHRFPEAGHYVLEDEREAVVSLVQAFFAKQPAKAAAAAS